MTERLRIIVQNLPSCKVFADIGCDHGYLSLNMLELNKCERVEFSDISKKCLDKASELLADYVKQNRAKGFVRDGFIENSECDLALIAGMGGLEICSILDKCKRLPSKLCLQPMKNVDRVRIKAVEKGYKILTDKIFKANGKFYDILVLEKGEDSLTEEEIEFGRTNVKSLGEDFREYLKIKINKLEKYCKNKDMSEISRAQLLEELRRLKKYV